MPSKKIGSCPLVPKSHKKIEPSSIFDVPNFFAKIWHCSGTPKIGVAWIFGGFLGSKGHLPELYIKKLARPQNMGAQFPILGIWHPLPGLRKTHQFWCVCASTSGGGKYVILGSGAPYFACNHAWGPLGVGGIGC